MDIELFNYNLPTELIAQSPADKRDNSRLLVINKSAETYEDKHFFDIIDYLKPGDVLVRNNSKVIPARLYGTKKDTGAKVEVLILKINPLYQMHQVQMIQFLNQTLSLFFQHYCYFHCLRSFVVAPLIFYNLSYYCSI